MNETLKEIILVAMGIGAVFSPLAVEHLTPKDTIRMVNGVRCEQPYLSKSEGVVLRLREGMDISGARLCDLNKDGIVDQYRSELICFRPPSVAYHRNKPTEAQVKLFAEATRDFYSNSKEK